MPNIWSRVNTVLLICVLLAIAGMMAIRVSGGPLDPPGPPASTDAVKQPGTPISSAPFTITSPGHYYVTRNLSYTGAGAAISISASNVTLDLGGFSLLGNDTANSSGVYVTGFFFPITIERGIVRDFSIGVDGVNGSMVRIRDVTAYSNGVGILVGNVTEISNCTIGVNAQQGIRVTGSLGRIQNCLVFDSGLDGIRIEGFGNLIESNRLVRNNTLMAELGGEISLSTGNSNVLRGNTIRGGTHSGGSGYTMVANTYCNFVDAAPIVNVDNVVSCS